ncbi:hypothetical protein ACN28C_00210 [Plantactinospora sp. WMMC1484]|uniref:hypothetical protein n=1 Tax=Plantactinospora sp. WMMC1484 TaxID=3404122 RepID=UPI003BF53CC6
MVEQHSDPSGNTEAFRAFAHSSQPTADERPSRLPLILGVAIVGVALVVLAGWLALG